ncbi:MAG TPA: adenosylmethionine--8-amino-7-oxononanoate transaminase [Candidatus Binataceae bacterium]|nr:adenosylmethionine--8-amino-7-oxononanoate transaminase [Candidatus Binataceae bacterium]
MSDSRYRELKELDHRFVWHPFTQMRTWMAADPLIIERGEGNYLIDTQGRRYLDGVSSLWCNVHGHRKRELDDALIEQSKQIAHSTMLGLANVPATMLARELVEIAPPELSRVFYSDSGAEAVEVAARMAAQYWQVTGQPHRTRFLTLTESYHGDTIGSVSLGYSEMFHRHVRPLLFSTIKTDPPHIFRFQRGMAPEAATQEALSAARQFIQEHGRELAALAIEPMVQGAAGIWTHSAEFLRGITAVAREAGALIVCDEVATGFGRTGKMFASEHAGIEPDLLCMGKGITGGYLPLAATLACEKIFSAFLGEPADFRAFYYGHTYTGNPLAAAVARANLKIFRDEAVLDRIQPRIAQLADGLRDRFAKLANVADIRQCGMMAGIELMDDPARKVPYKTERQIGVAVIMAARNAGVVIRPLGNVIVLMPPLSITESELDTLLDVTRAAIVEVTERTS